jgi:Fic family protein
MTQYVWETSNWPNFFWNSEMLINTLSEVRKRQGRFLRTMEELGFEDSLRAYAVTIEEDAIQTAAIEGEKLDREKVRSSVAVHLGLSSAGLSMVDRAVDGLVEILLDATHNHENPLEKERLCRWHTALFPLGRPGFQNIVVGAWRTVPMQVVSGAYGRAIVHYEAPPPERLESEMALFFTWWQESRKMLDGIFRAALAHLYFVTIHPFDDGNGRLARTISDMALAQDEGLDRRYYSLAAQIMKERDAYYRILETTQKGDGECTDWLLWFIRCFDHALEEAEATLAVVLFKATFWKRHAEITVNERQRKVLNTLLDIGKGNFEGGLSTRKYMGMTKTSRATAWREIEDMLQKKMLRALPGRGRNAAYEIAWDGLV